mmetsp:Transcript_22551/g.36332  ORF Transcript_22551/g.36332 Transcript_22551/m.36332 type:complete len:285 (-) Transcript_22551:196-1050(-)
MKDTNGDSHHYPSPHQNSRKKKLKEGGNNCHKHDNISQQPQRRPGARRGGREVSYSVHSVLKHKQNAGKGRCRTGSSDEYNNVSHGCNRMNSKENNLGAEGKNKIPSSHLTLNTKDHSASKWKKQIPTPSGSKMCANKPCDMAYILTFHGCNVDVGLRLGMGKHTTVGHVYDIATKRILCKNINLILHRGAGFGGGAWVLKGPPDKFQRAQKLTDIGVHPMRNEIEVYRAKPGMQRKLKMKKLLHKLAQRGFCDEELNEVLLTNTEGNLKVTLRWLKEHIRIYE